MRRGPATIGERIDYYCSMLRRTLSEKAEGGDFRHTSRTARSLPRSNRAALLQMGQLFYFPYPI